MTSSVCALLLIPCILAHPRLSIRQQLILFLSCKRDRVDTFGTNALWSAHDWKQPSVRVQIKWQQHTPSHSLLLSLAVCESLDCNWTLSLMVTISNLSFPIGSHQLPEFLFDHFDKHEKKIFLTLCLPVNWHLYQLGVDDDELRHGELGDQLDEENDCGLPGRFEPSAPKIAWLFS